MIVLPSFSKRSLALVGAVALSALAAGCSTNEALTTGALNGAAVKPAAIDQACAPLAAQIEGLRKEGTTERLEKAAAGKGTTVSVQRVALTKQAELNKANADFIAKCGPNLPKSTVAAAVAPAVAAAPVAAKAVAVAKQGVTVATPAAVVPAAAAAASAAPKQ